MSYSSITATFGNKKDFTILSAATLTFLIVSYFVIQSDHFDNGKTIQVSNQKINGDTYSPEISDTVLYGMKKPEHLSDQDWGNFQAIKNTFSVAPLDPVEMGFVTERSGRNGLKEPVVSRTRESLRN